MGKTYSIPGEREACLADIKVGDHVRRVSKFDRNDYSEGTISKIEGTKVYLNIITETRAFAGKHGEWDLRMSCVDSTVEIINRGTAPEPEPMTSIMQKLKKLTRKEPMKSFVSLGVTDENGNLTSEGHESFVQFLFERTDLREMFYNEVVKPLSEAADEEKK